MIKPDERVLQALNTLDRDVVEWLSRSLAQIHKDLEQAGTNRQAALLQGQAQAVRSILNSASGAREALERIRS